MLKKEIELALSVKMDFVRQLLPEELRNDFIQSSYIAGGCFASLFNDEKVNDYDIFFSNAKLKDDIVKYFTDYAEKAIKKEENRSDFRFPVWHKEVRNRNNINGIYSIDEKNYEFVMTDNAILIGDIHFITKWTGKIEEVLNDFDFVHDMIAFNGEIITGNATIENVLSCIKYKILKYNKECTKQIAYILKRLAKFLDRNYTIKQSELLYIFSLIEFHDEEQAKLLKELSNYG